MGCFDAVLGDLSAFSKVPLARGHGLVDQEVSWQQKARRWFRWGVVFFFFVFLLQGGASKNGGFLGTFVCC